MKKKVVGAKVRVTQIYTLQITKAYLTGSDQGQPAPAFFIFCHIAI